MQIGLRGNMPAAEVTNKTVNRILWSFAAQVFAEAGRWLWSPCKAREQARWFPNTHRRRTRVSVQDGFLQGTLCVLSDILP